MQPVRIPSHRRRLTNKLTAFVCPTWVMLAPLACMPLRRFRCLGVSTAAHPVAGSRQTDSQPHATKWRLFWGALVLAMIHTCGTSSELKSNVQCMLPGVTGGAVVPTHCLSKNGYEAAAELLLPLPRNPASSAATCARIHPPWLPGVPFILRLGQSTLLADARRLLTW